MFYMMNLRYLIKGSILTAVFLTLAVPGILSAETFEQKQFTYHIFWSGIRAGKAVLDYEVTEEGTVIKTRATSASFISLFYKVDDRAESTLYPNGYPRQFTLKIREGRHRRHKVTTFGPYVPERPQKIIFNNILDDESVEFEISKGAYDPLSAFYAMTKAGLIVGQSAFIDIFDNKKLWNTEIQVLGKEKVRVIAGEFDTIVVKPLLKSEGIFLKKGEMHIWITDDERKIPVLFKSKAKIGHFKAVLAEGDL